MKRLVLRWVILTAAVLFAAYVIDGIHVAGVASAIWGAGMLGLLNAFFRPIIIILTLPINILTLGLFTFVINALMLKMASGIIPGFEVHGFMAAVLGSLIITAVNWFLTSLVKEPDQSSTIDLHKHGDHWE